MYSGHYGRVDQLPESTEHFSLEPGDGLFIPPRAVHMLEVGDARSVSLSIVFHTPALDRAAQVYAFNAKARAVGRRPRPPGSSRATDAAKSATVSIWRAARRVSRILLRRGALPSVEAERRAGTLT